jgi:hypothetical protein
MEGGASLPMYEYSTPSTDSVIDHVEYLDRASIVEHQNYKPETYDIAYVAKKLTTAVLSTSLSSGG